MTITVDINVLLDVFQNRTPHYAASARVIGQVIAGKVSAIFPAHGLTTLYYLVRRHSSRGEAESAMDQVLRHFEIRSLDADGWQKARKLPLADFEDAAVAIIAAVSGSTFIVTRNIADFRGSPVPAISPADFLTK